MIVAWCLAGSGPVAAQTLDIYFIDVEGGAATLIVTPDGRSMLIDTGWDGFGNRDADRIQAAARDAQLTKLDFLLITHFHRDHVGGAPEIVRRLPVGTFIDYGEPVEEGEFTQVPFAAYAALRASGLHRRPAPGETIAFGGVRVDIVSTGGAVISQPLSGVDAASNAACAGQEMPPNFVNENTRSTGIRLRFGDFTFLDVGDLAGANLVALACPNNLLGHADVYLVPHHGGADTAIPSVVAAVSPRVAILNNGVTKGGSAAAFVTLRQANGIEDAWQLHRSRNEGAMNYPDEFIANLEDGPGDTGAWVKVSADERGNFTVTNARTGFSKSYR